MTLDDKDRLLLAALAANARESVVGLARRIGLSRSATQERLQRLERSGAIAGYSVRLADSVTGEAGVQAYVALTFEAGTSCDHLVPKLAALPQIGSCHALAGPIDLMLTVRCASNGELSTLREQIAALPGVASVTTHVRLATRFDRGAG